MIVLGVYLFMHDNRNKIHLNPNFAFSVILCCRLADVKLNLSIRAFVRLHVWWLMMLELANVKTNIMYVCACVSVCVGAMSTSLVVFHYDFE